ncbi:MAG: 4Fe-4S ferredoxin [Desulfobacterales bacterium]|nr:4Fe-4S ferredoxin [Desulfobacterales bacterium]
MNASDDVYHKLRERIDQAPIGFPQSKTGAEIRLLKHLFTPGEAEIALALSEKPRSLERIHEKLEGTGLTIRALERKLDGLVQKGAIFGPAFHGRSGEGRCYSLAMLAVGMYELQNKNITREYMLDLVEYSNEKFHQELHSKKTSQMRTIPIRKSIKPGLNVDIYDNVRELIKNTGGRIAVTECICKKGKDLFSLSCKCTDARETCFMLEDWANHYLELGFARSVTKEEAMKLLERAEKAGLVFQPENSRKPQFICCCCGCCCGILGAVKKFPRPAEYYHSNYRAEVDPNKCKAYKGCDICVKRCHMDAVTVESYTASVDPDRCIGCGACAPTCPRQAIALHKKSDVYTPEEDSEAMYRKIWEERENRDRTARKLSRIK